MSTDSRSKERSKENLRTRLGKHATSAALIASMVPLAQAAVAPSAAIAQCDPNYGCTVTVPEPSTVLLLAPAAALLLRRRIKARKTGE
jgi:hypothetical protein